MADFTNIDSLPILRYVAKTWVIMIEQKTSARQVDKFISRIFKEKETEVVTTKYHTSNSLQIWNHTS